MDRLLQKALAITILSLGLAFVFNFLFFDRPTGISVFIFTTILLGAVYVYGRQQNLPVRGAWWLFLLIGFFALMPSIRGSELLNFLNLCATLGLLLLLAHELAGTPVFFLKLRDYLLLVLLEPFRMLRRAFSTLSIMGQIESPIGRRAVWRRIAKGTIMALPILVIFGVLFSQADLAFSLFLKSFSDVSISVRTLQYSVLWFFAFAAALSFLSYIFLPQPFRTFSSDSQVDKTTWSSHGIEVLVFLGLIAALFLVFIIFQVTYLFGGEANIAETGFTYAEYARRGFWELLAVALLSLVVLLAADEFVGESKKEKWFLLPALVLVAEVMIVIASAFKRLSLYIEAYGMTELRFYVIGFILLLSAWFILLAFKFIRSKPEQFFAFGTLLSVAAFLVIVNIANPHAFIVKANTQQYERTSNLDVAYVGGLSADAIPENIRLYEKLHGEEKAALYGLLQSQKENLQAKNDEWRSANLARARALKVLNDFEK